MRRFAIALCLALACFVHRAHAQTTVTTTGLAPQQCVQADSSSSIVPLGCSGRKNVIMIATDTLLINSQCGSLIEATSVIAEVEVTMPPTPPANCEFTFEPGVPGLFVNWLFRESSG
jgi:hypothetical protein